MAARSYAFGDSDLAAQRLELVADTFDAPSREFLIEAVRTPPALALDLGCATGRTTRLLAEATEAARTVGLDWSESFLTQARAAARHGTDFVLHDVSRVPFPVRPAGLVYGRLLLAHLPEPEAMVAAWVGELEPGGLLLLDEVEFMRTDDPVLTAYEEIVTGLVASRGADLEVGPRLGRLRDGDGWQVRSSAVRRHDVPVPVAARMYGMNLATWHDDPHVVSTWSPDVIHGMAGDLDRLVRSDDTRVVEWGLRQIVIERH